MCNSVLFFFFFGQIRLVSEGDGGLHFIFPLLKLGLSWDQTVFHPMLPSGTSNSMGHLYPWQVYQCLPSTFPRVPQYTLKKEALKRLQLLISKFLKNSILSPCNSPCNTPILAFRKSDDTYHLVQNLRTINQAVVPIHPTVSNP